MRIYHYHPQTKEFIGVGSARPDPLEGERFLIPANSTEKEPPTTFKNEVAVFENNSWSVKADYRGTVYWIDGVKKQINIIGEVLPDGHSFTKPEKTEGEIKKEVRSERDSLLKESDWTQLPDAPVDQTAWATYRQELRDITQQEGFPENVTWPTKPE